MAAKGTVHLRITAVVIGLLGLVMAVQGIDLLVAGGTPYYALAGVLMTASGVQLFRRQPSGFHIYAVVLLITLAWAVYEAGTDFWMVGSRIWLVGIFALRLCMPGIRRAVWEDEDRPFVRAPLVMVCALASFAVLGSMTANLLLKPVLAIEDTVYGEPQNESDWTAYGGSQAGTRYAPHDAINRDNVAQLEQVWTADTGRVGRFSATPIQIEDGIYLCTAQNVVIALDGDTGEERWRFDPENDTPAFGILGNCRGVTYYHIPDRPKGEQCAERIYTATTDARMIALDMHSGLPCDEFGDDGEISLLAGMGEVKPFYYFVTSPPTVASGGLVVGGWVADNQETEEPSGVVRSYDPRTGDLLWAWDMGREGDTALPPEGESFTRGTPNVWSLTSADDELGLVYVPTGNATPDYFGGHRTAIMDEFASSVVAIDANTGISRWHFQTAHHDIWDYDVPSQPTLVDLTIDGERHKAVIVPTKRGELFVLDRETGELITEVTERPVPQTDLPAERTSATQPFSTGMPSFEYPYVHESDMFGISPFDQMACRKAYRGLRYEGPMTPPSVQGTLLYPGPAGGMNWGSVAVDEQRQLMVVNTMHLAFTVHMIPREDALPESEDGFTSGYGIGGPQRGTPFAARVNMFASPLGMPCLKPPFGEVAVVDLTTQQVVWRRGAGFWDMGFPYAAGSIVTKGGLIFQAGVVGGQIYAYDVLSGKVLWEEPLPRPSDATPMSYVSPRTGRQYLLVTVPGTGRGVGDGDSREQPEAVDQEGGKVIAYALTE